MKKTILYFILFIFSVPIFADNLSNLSTQQMQFVNFMVPKINQANHEILILRKHLIYLRFIEQKGKTLDAKQKQWLYKLAHDYKITDVDFAHQKAWEMLMKKVDILPDSLVLAQAINESGWGNSYFATNGHNYFGQWCTKPGCGLVPRKRPKGATYEVSKYASPLDSVRSYIHNVDSHRSYRELRDLRYQLRLNHKILSGIVLAEGMNHYSQRGDVYVRILQDIIKRYNFSALDKV